MSSLCLINLKYLETSSTPWRANTYFILDD